MHTKSLSTNKKHKALELETRRKIYLLVLKNPGSHFREILRRSSFAHGTLKYHLNFLAKHHLILAKKQNNSLRYFPENFKTENIKLLSFLRQKPIRDIILYIITNPNASHESITRFTNRSPSTISWHLNKLISANIIEVKKSGRQTHYNLKENKDEIIKLLITYKESFIDTLVNKTLDMWDLN